MMSTPMSIVTPEPPSTRRRGKTMGWRVSVSIAATFGWLSFILLYFAFWAGTYSTGQTIVVIVVSILVYVGINGATWAPWGMRNSTSPPP